MNDSAWVVSQDEYLAHGPGPAVHFRAGSCLRLSEAYDSRLASVSAINNSGWMVGVLITSLTTPVLTRAVLLVNGATIPLDELAPSFGQWPFVSAVRINDAGQIVAESGSGGRRVMFLLSPP